MERLVGEGDAKVPYREMLVASAARGNIDAINTLRAADPPAEMLYLVEWTNEIIGRSGTDMNGFAPLSYATIMSWATLHGHRLTTLEVDGLMALDAALRYREPADG